MNDQRTTIMGLSRGNWIVLGLFVIGLIGTAFTQYRAYGQTLQQVEVNTKAIERMPEQFHEELMEVEGRISKKIDEQTKRQEAAARETRQDIKEILRALK